MAKDNTDQVTGELFNGNEKEMLKQTIETHLATLRRKVNSEQNPQIKNIRQQEVQEYVNLANKVQGLKS